MPCCVTSGTRRIDIDSRGCRHRSSKVAFNCLRYENASRCVPGACLVVLGVTCAYDLVGPRHSPGCVGARGLRFFSGGRRQEGTGIRFDGQVAYFLVHSAAILSWPSLSVMYCCAMLATNGSAPTQLFSKAHLGRMPNLWCECGAQARQYQTGLRRSEGSRSTAALSRSSAQDSSCPSGCRGILSPRC